MFCQKFSRFSKVLFVSFLILVTSVFISLSVKAVESQKYWSWTDADPTVFSSIPANPINGSWCYSTIFQKHIVSGEANPIDVCMMGNGDVNFGLYYDGYIYTSVISFGNDIKMLKVTDACDQNSRCLYMPDTDTLVRKVNKTLNVYKNFTNRLSKYFDHVSLTNKYSFNYANPDYTFQSSEGRAWPIEGIGASSNGKWLAMEFRLSGIGLLNIETLEMKRISNRAWTYDVGLNPITEFAVSNDGFHVAQMGLNAGIAIYDVNQNCGDIADDLNMILISPLVNPCEKAYIHNVDLVPGFSNATQPIFSDDGGELDFYAMSSRESTRRVALRASGYSGRRLEYLALGDSYSSGEGDLDDRFYINGTNNDFEKCHTSSRSYPFNIANAFGISEDNFKSVACSGARMVDVIGSDTNYQGQGDRLGIGQLDLSDLDQSSYKIQALEQFIPGRVHQNSFVQMYQPSVITIGISGNDAGLITKLSGCLGPITCDWAGTAEGKEKTAVEIKNLYPNLVNSFNQIKNISPNSKIHVIGYPKIIETNGDCSAFEDFLLDKTEREYINESINYLNQVISSASSSAGVEYIDIHSSFGNHVICGSEQESAVNTVKYGDDIGPFEGKKWFKVIGQESFHPNQLGHDLTGQMIISNASDILNNLDSINSFSQFNNVAPEPPISLLLDGYHDYSLQKSEDFIFNRPYISNSTQINIKLDNYSVEPNSLVTIETNSVPKLSWTFNSSSTGSIDATFNLPANLKEGIYVFHLLGSSYSGENIDLYQVINFWDPNELPEEPPVEPPIIPVIITNPTINTPIVVSDEQTNVSNSLFTNYFKSTKLIDEISDANGYSNPKKITNKPVNISKNVYLCLITSAIFLFFILPMIYMSFKIFRKIIASYRNKSIK